MPQLSHVEGERRTCRTVLVLSRHEWLTYPDEGVQAIAEDL